jgi:hypothetical protein
MVSEQERINSDAALKTENQQTAWFCEIIISGSFLAFVDVVQLNL